MLGRCCVFYFYFYFTLHSQDLQRKSLLPINKKRKGLIFKYQTRKHRAKLPNYKG